MHIAYARVYSVCATRYSHAVTAYLNRHELAVLQVLVSRIAVALNLFWLVGNLADLRSMALRCTTRRVNVVNQTATRRAPHQHYTIPPARVPPARLCHSSPSDADGAAAREAEGSTVRHAWAVARTGGAKDHGLSAKGAGVTRKRVGEER